MSRVPVPSGEIPVVSDVGLPVPEPENPQSTPQGETPGSDEGNLPSNQGVSGDPVQAVPAIVTWPNAPIFEQLQRETDLLYEEGWLDDPAPWDLYDRTPKLPDQIEALSQKLDADQMYYQVRMSQIEVYVNRLEVRA